MTPRFPEPDLDDPPPSNQARDAATCLAAAGLLCIAGFLAILVFFVLPVAISYVVALAVIIAGTLVLHYYTWGRYLLQTTREEVLSAENRSDHDSRTEQSHHTGTNQE